MVSKVANFALDLPEANVAVHISGTFDSRQEEVQRLGRILLPRFDGALARLYSVVARKTLDQDYSADQQFFLTEEGYGYSIVDATQLLSYAPENR